MSELGYKELVFEFFLRRIEFIQAELEIIFERMDKYEDNIERKEEARRIIELTREIIEALHAKDFERVEKLREEMSKRMMNFIDLL